MEVLVAFLILSLSLGVIMNILSLSASTAHLTDSRQRALLFAESKMAELAVDPDLKSGVSQGEFDEKFRWEASITEWEFPDYDPSLSTTVTPYQITLAVSWSDLPTERITLHSVHLVMGESL